LKYIAKTDLILISNALKCAGGWSYAPRPLGELTTLPGPPPYFTFILPRAK